jgi:hypothetical protein
MASRRCSRCGRVDDEEKGPLPPEGGLPRIWASFDGEDVCPDCQTPAERREAATRLLAAVEAEIERRQQAGVEPDAVESAITGYALALRQALETEPAPPEEPVRQTFAVAFTGAFVTGTTPTVRIADYDRLQAALGESLRKPGWRVRELDRSGGTYESGGGFAHPLPLVVARRDGPELLGQLRYGIDRPDADRLAVAPGYRFDPQDLQIDVYDLGVAVLTAWFDVAAPPTHAAGDLTRTVKRVAWLRPSDGRSSIADALQEIARETVTDFRRAAHTALPAAQLQAPWPERDGDGGRLLWLHPIHVLQDAHASEDTIAALAPVFHRTLTINGAVFAPGNGWSAVALTPDSGGAATPIRLTQLHWAYYALYMELDRGLLAVLNDARGRTSARLKELEREARGAFRTYLSVMEARARLDTELSSLGGDERAIWDAIADVQRFESVVDGVERKIEVLQRLTQRRADEAAARRARGISESLAFLSALTVVTVAIGVVGYLLGARNYVQGHDELRTVVIVVAALVAVALAGFAYRGRRDRPEP